MKKILLLLFTALLLVQYSSYALNEETCGKIVVSADEWPTTNEGYTKTVSGSTDQFVKNVANYFTGGAQGHFLIATDNFAYASSFRNSLTSAGHTFVHDKNATNYSDYDGIFIGGQAYNITLLTNYVESGGCVYVVGGTGFNNERGILLNPFLNQYGLEFDPYPNTGKWLITNFSFPQLFSGVTNLYTWNPNEMMSVLGPYPNTQIVSNQFGYNWWAVYEAPCDDPRPPVENDLALWLDADNVNGDGTNPPPDSFFDIWVDLTTIQEDGQAGSDDQRPVWRETGINGNPGVEFVINYDPYGYGLSDIMCSPYNEEITTAEESRWEPDNADKTCYIIIKTGTSVDDPDDDDPYYSDGRQCIFEIGGPLSGINTYISNGKIAVGAWNRFERKFTILNPGGGYYDADIGNIYLVKYSYDGLDRKIETAIGKYEPGGSTISTAGPLKFQGLTRDATYPDDNSGVGGACRTRYHDYSTGETHSDHFNGLIGELMLYNGIPDDGAVLAYLDSKFGTNFASAAVSPKLSEWIVIDESETTESLSLSKSWPNPFIESTSFAVNLPESMNVKIDLVNSTGQSIRSIFEGQLNAGMSQLTIDGSDMNPGAYFSRIITGNNIEIGKVIRIR